MYREFHSKPRYRPLTPLPDRPHHFLITDLQGVERAKALLALTGSNRHCVVICESQTPPLITDAKYLQRETLPEYLAALLPGLPTATQFYLLGRERFIWTVQVLLQDLHVPRAQCAVERCGPIERDVLCIHCRHTMTEVRDSLVICDGCKLLLQVYDHFSRRLGCYMGFQVNAECEGDIPAREELRS